MEDLLQDKENDVRLSNMRMKLRSPPKRKSSARWKKRLREQHFATGDWKFSMASPAASPQQPEQQNETNSFTASMTDDLFLHMMGFFVSKCGAVDGDTIKSMSQVSKQWYGLVNAPSIWPSSHDCTVQDMYTTDTVSSALIGFRKVERVSSLWSSDAEGIVYRVVERATQQLYVVRITQGATYPLLAHMACTHQLLGNEHLLVDAPPEISNAVVFPLRVEQCRDSAVLWYDNCEQSLEHWFKTNDRCANQYLCDPEPSRSLPYPLSHLKGWFRDLLSAIHLLERLGLIVDDTDSWSWIRTESIFIDRDSSRLRLLVPASVSWEPASPDETSTGCLSAILSGAIFTRIMKCGKPWDISTCPRFEIARGSKWLKPEIPSLDDSGLDFLSRLLSRSNDEGLEVKEALLHPFLSNETLLQSFLLSESDIRRTLFPTLNAREPTFLTEIQLKPNRRHVLPDEWAILADWLFEICLTFDMYINDAYRAMQYFDEAFSTAELRIPRSNYQLLAGACLLISAKLIGSAAIHPVDIAFCADNIFDAADVVETEQFVLQQIGWRLARPTMWDFTSSHISMDLEGRRMMNYISEWAQQSQLYLNYRPFVSAAAVVVVARYCISRHPLWPDDTQERSGLSLADLQKPVSDLLADIYHIRSTLPNLKMIARGSNGLILQRPIPLSLDLVQSNR